MDNQEEWPQPEFGSQPAVPRRSRVYYGWFVVAASMIISTAVLSVSDSFSLFRGFFTDFLKMGPDIINHTHLIGALLGGFSQPILGYMFDRLNSRKVILISIAVAGVATLGLTLADRFVVAAFLYTVVIFAASGATFGVLGPLATRWFLRRRTLVLALLMAGPTVGSAVLVSIATYDVVAYGWRVAWIVLGAVLLFLALPFGLKFLRNWPSEMGLKADGDPESPVENSMRGKRSCGRFEVESWQCAFRSPPIWVLLPTFAVGGFAANAAGFLVFFAVDSMGGPVVLGSIFSSVITMLGVIGVLAGGWMSDRFTRKKVLGAMFLAQSIAFLVLMAMQTPAGLWLFAVLTGLCGAGGMFIALVLLADIYGLRALGTLWGIAILFHSIGGVIAPSMVSLAILFTGSHLLPTAACALMLGFASIMVFVLNERKYSPRYQVAS